MKTILTPENSGLAIIEIQTLPSGRITHNYPCPVCQQTKAVLMTGQEHFRPCIDCSSAGWEIVDPSVRRKSIRSAIFFGILAGIIVFIVGFTFAIAVLP